MYDEDQVKLRHHKEQEICIKETIDKITVLNEGLHIDLTTQDKYTLILFEIPEKDCTDCD